MPKETRNRWFRLYAIQQVEKAIGCIVAGVRHMEDEGAPAKMRAELARSELDLLKRIERLKLVPVTKLEKLEADARQSIRRRQRNP